MAVKLIVLLLLCGSVIGDMYLQNPRGNNDRLNEASDRVNAQRLFDSENNARGGYCWGPAMSFVEGSFLPIEWTAQHGCGGPHVTCTEIIQYMCEDNSASNAASMIRDGTTTNTIPADSTQYNQKDNTGTYVYGMNENLQYYQDCNARQRNMGLFVADQTPGSRAINTRQNPAGTRYGFECAEERDYYPYWHPSPWKDIAVLTDTIEHCAFYQAESQNVKSKNYCKITTTNNAAVPNNEMACTTAGGVWSTEPAFGIPAPECKLAAFSRDNHLGNTIGGAVPANYTWTVPTADVEPCVSTGSAGSCNCILRIRYNITTNESSGVTDQFIDSRNNSIIHNNPTMNVTGGELTLALNTAQYGRTFQDRSYVFHITPRPSGVSADTKIYNLNVRGKRGNIVQTYPATEYDFVPNRLNVEEGDMVHFQWTGCDTNPAGNTGEGRDQTDRSNIVQIQDLDSNIPVVSANSNEQFLFESEFLRGRMALLGQTGCVSPSKLNNPQQDQTNCANLNAAPTPYFDGGLVRMNNSGTHTYMSTRNNNFSNRTQKGQITIGASKKKKMSSGATAGVVIAVLAVVACAIGGAIYYGKKNPTSKIGGIVNNIRMPMKSGSTANVPRREALLKSDYAN